MKNTVIYSQCENYAPENVDNSMEFIFSNLEGLEEKIKSAKKILIKPNLLTPRPPNFAVTTHPQVLISLINKLKSYNAEIILGDTPAGALNEKVIDKLYTVCKMKQVAEETGCKLNYDFSDFSAHLPDSKIAKSIKTLNIAEQADLIINFAKLKTHCFTMITCATKNHFGLVPGLLKIKYHLTLNDTDVFSNMLIDIERHFDHKTIHFVDGILGMEGFGPSNGKPIESKSIIAGYDSIYLDILACHVMGVKPEKILTISEAYKRGLIEHMDINKLNIIKNTEIQTYNFKLPPDRGKTLPSFVPKRLTKILNNFFIPKPVFNHEKCIGCGNCEESCPPQLIKINNKLASINNYTECIKCYCCQEVCPVDAIELQDPPGRRLLKVFKLR